MVLVNISPLIRQVDFALDWLHLDAGNVLYKQGSQATTVYIVLSGRVRAVLQVWIGDESAEEQKFC